MWLYRLPMAARIGVFAVVVFGAFVGVDALVGLYTGSLVSHLVTAAVTAVVVAAVVMILGERKVRRDFGSIERFIEYTRGLRTGELPAHIEPDVCRGWLNRSHKQNRMTLVAGVLWVVATLVNLIGRSENHWGFSAIFALCAIDFLVLWQLGRRRISRLATAVEQHAVC
jgi:hypothetical protein